MNSRQNNLIRQLLAASHFLPISTFSEELLCSEKTVYSDIRAINDFLISKNLITRIETKRGSGIRLTLVEQEKHLLENLLLINVVSTQSELERFFSGLIFLVCSAPAACTMESLTSELCTNRRQLQADIRHWNHLISFFSLSIKNKGGRLFIEGDEFAVRICLLYFLWGIATYYQKQETVPAILSDDLRFNQKILDMLSNSDTMPYSSNAYSTNSFYIALSIKRIRNGHMLTHFPGFVEIPPAYTAVERALEKHLGVAISKEEMQVISALSWACTRSTSIESLEPSPLDKQVNTYASALGGAFEKRFGKQISHDTEHPLSLLLQAAFARKNFHAPIAIPNALPMKYYHMDWFMLFMKLVYDTPKLQKMPLYSTDYARIAMLLFEQYESAHPQEAYRVALVVSCGAEQAFFGRYKLESRTPHLQVVKTISEHELRDDSLLKYVRDSVDFFISFDPVEIDAPVCCVSPSVNETDVAELRRFIRRYRLRKTSRTILPPPKISQLTYDSIPDIVTAIYWDAKNQDVLDMPPELFAQAFDNQNAVVNDIVIVPLLLKGIKNTAVHLYTTKNLWLVQPVATVAVLFVAERDEEALPSLTAQFKKHLEGHLNNTPGYCLPPFALE